MQCKEAQEVVKNSSCEDIKGKVITKVEQVEGK